MCELTVVLHTNSSIPIGKSVTDTNIQKRIDTTNTIHDQAPTISSATAETARDADIGAKTA